MDAVRDCRGAMTLANIDYRVIESAQASAVQGAGGCLLSGCFRFAVGGWELTLTHLTFQELLRIAEAARAALEK